MNFKCDKEVTSTALKQKMAALWRTVFFLLQLALRIFHVYIFKTEEIIRIM